MTDRYADAEPDEIVNVGSQPMTLRAAVRIRVSQRNQPGVGLMAVYREVGKVPSWFEASDLDKLAEMERFR